MLFQKCPEILNNLIEKYLVSKVSKENNKNRSIINYHKNESYHSENNSKPCISTSRFFNSLYFAVLSPEKKDVTIKIQRKYNEI